MKICSKCTTKKSLDDFNWKNKAKNQKMAWCKACIKVYDKARQSTPEYRAEKKVRREDSIRLNKAYVFSYLTNNSCVDCGNKDFRVLEFDHTPGTDKCGNISDMISRASLNTLKKEIAKCEIRCANCHRIITMVRAGNWRHTVALDSKFWEIFETLES